MTTLNIKDPRVYELASDLAERRHTSMTAVVRSALEAALEAELALDEVKHSARERALETKVETLQRIARRSAERPEPVLAEADLYDPGTGLPWS
ncbi:type II toxin-antitoxin system VapB family antitoxin [Salana multivorans]